MVHCFDDVFAAEAWVRTDRQRFAGIDADNGQALEFAPVAPVVGSEAAYYMLP